MKNMNLKIFLVFCTLSLVMVTGVNAQMKLKQVGPSAEKKGNSQMLSFSMLGEALGNNDFISLKKLRKEGASTVLNYEIDLSSFRRLKPNDVTFKMTLLRDGAKLKKNTWRHVEKSTSLDLAEMLSIAEADDSLLIEISGLPLKSTEKVSVLTSLDGKRYEGICRHCYLSI